MNEQVNEKPVEKTVPQREGQAPAKKPEGK